MLSWKSCHEVVVILALQTDKLSLKWFSADDNLPTSKSYEPPHDKTNKWLCAQWRLRSRLNIIRRIKKISLDQPGIHPVWSESSMCAHWAAKDPSFLHADSEDSDQTERMPRLIWVFAGCICHFDGFVMRRLLLFLLCFATFYHFNM